MVTNWEQERERGGGETNVFKVLGFFGVERFGGCGDGHCCCRSVSSGFGVSWLMGCGGEWAGE